MISLIFAAFFIYLWFSLRNRIDRLEKTVARLSQAPLPVSAPAPAAPVAGQAVPVGMPTPAVRMPQRPVTYAPSGPTAFDNFAAWLKEDWLLKLGALLLLIGFGWLVTYAFLNNWIGPVGRIVFGLAAGAAIQILGTWRIRTFSHQGSIFLTLGSTVILLTIFAARTIYSFFTPASALALMFLSPAFVAVVSVKHKAKGLALASLVLAGIAPLLTNAPPGSDVALFSYLLVVVLGAIWVVALTGQRDLTFAALVMVGLYSLPHLIGFSGTDRGVLLLFAYAFATIFFLSNIAAIVRSKGQSTRADLFTAIGTGIFLLAWISVAVKPEWQSLIMSAWMLVFSVGAFAAYRATRRVDAFYVYAGVAVAFLAAATAAELSGPVLTIAYTVESALVVLGTYLIVRNIQVAEQSSAVLIGPMVLSLSSIGSSAWSHGVLHDDFFVLATIVLVNLLLGSFFRDRQSTLPHAEKSTLPIWMYGISSVYAYILLWLSLHAALRNDDLAVMISLFIYTVIGLITNIMGKMQENRTLRRYGGTMLALVVARLLFVDVWNMALTGRIITFFVVGTLLMSTAFIGRKKNIPPVNS